MMLVTSKLWRLFVSAMFDFCPKLNSLQEQHEASSRISHSAQVFMSRRISLQEECSQATDRERNATLAGFPGAKLQ